MPSPLPLVHIGYQKCASSFLQQNLFAGQEKLRLVPKRFARQELIDPAALSFDPECAQEAWRRKLGSLGTEGEIPVLSSERLSGDPHQGGQDAAMIARRIHLMTGGAKILVVVREQSSMLASLYAQYVREGGRLDLKRYLEPSGYPVPQLRLEFLEYHRLVEYYRALFGGENVLVLPMEMLGRAPLQFTKAVSSFLDVALTETNVSRIANPALSPLGVAVKRRLNWCVRQKYNPTGLFRSKELGLNYMAAMNRIDRRLPSTIREFGRGRDKQWIQSTLTHCYRESNERLAELTGLDLLSFGYAVGTPQ